MKRMFKSCLTALGILTPLFLSSQTIITIGNQDYLTDPTNQLEYGFYSYFGSFFDLGSRQQALYTSAELIDAGAQPGDIVGLQIEIFDLDGTLALTNFSISMGHTALNSYPDASLINSGLVEVLALPSYQPRAGTNEHLFTTPFNWDGASNVLVDICQDATTIRHHPSMYFSFDDTENTYFLRAFGTSL
jgi:hypothetical protein